MQFEKFLGSLTLWQYALQPRLGLWQKSHLAPKRDDGPCPDPFDLRSPSRAFEKRSQHTSGDVIAADVFFFAQLQPFAFRRTVLLGPFHNRSSARIWTKAVGCWAANNS